MADATVQLNTLLFLLYFGQGLPYGFQVKLLPLLLRKQSFSLSKVGLSRLLSLPWIFKFTVAPLVDNLWSLSSWIMSGLLVMSVLCFISALVGVSNTFVFLLCVFWMNLTSAVQDVAVDAFAISVLNPSDLGTGSTLQVVGYKVGALFGGGLLTWLSFFCSWELLFCLWGSFYIVILILLVIKTQYCSQHVKRVEVPFSKNHSMEDGDSLLSDSAIKNKDLNRENQILFSDGMKTGKLGVTQILRNIFQTPDFLWLVCFVLTYKLGEQGVVSMLPLFLIDQGIPQDQVGVLSGIFGQVFSIAGSMVGGWIVGFCSGHRSWMITVLLWTSFTRLLPLAFLCLLSLTTLTKFSAVILECSLQLIGGIITTATFTVMMLSSQNSFQGTKASHCAILATAEVLGKLSMISLSGILVDIIGYQCFFGLCLGLALLAIPVVKGGSVSPSKKSL